MFVYLWHFHTKLSKAKTTVREGSKWLTAEREHNVRKLTHAVNSK